MGTRYQQPQGPIEIDGRTGKDYALNATTTESGLLKLTGKSGPRIRNELLSESLANDLISRTKRRKAQAEEALILLLI